MHGRKRDARAVQVRFGIIVGFGDAVRRVCQDALPCRDGVDDDRAGFDCVQEDGAQWGGDLAGCQLATRNFNGKVALPGAGDLHLRRPEAAKIDRAGSARQAGSNRRLVADDADVAGLSVSRQTVDEHMQRLLVANPGTGVDIQNA